MSPVSGGRSAPSDGHGVDRSLRKPELSVLSSLSSLVYTTTKAKTEVTACSTRACIDAVGARVADAMQSPSSSEIGPTILYDEDESSTSDVAPGSAGNVGSCAIPPPHFTAPTQHATTPHATTTTPWVGAHRGRQRMFWGNWARKSEVYLPGLVRARVVDTMQSHDASGIGPPAQDVDDEGSLSDVTLPNDAFIAFPAADAAVDSADTRYFDMGSVGDDSHTPSESVLGSTPSFIRSLPDERRLKGTSLWKDSSRRPMPPTRGWKNSGAVMVSLCRRSALLKRPSPPIVHRRINFAPMPWRAKRRDARIMRHWRQTCAKSINTSSRLSGPSSGTAPGNWVRHERRMIASLLTTGRLRRHMPPRPISGRGSKCQSSMNLRPWPERKRRNFRRQWHMPLHDLKKRGLSTLYAVMTSSSNGKSCQLTMRNYGGNSRTSRCASSLVTRRPNPPPPLLPAVVGKSR